VVEHRVIDGAELLATYVLGENGVDFIVRGPEIGEPYGPARN